MDCGRYFETNNRGGMNMSKFLAVILSIIVVGGIYGISWIGTCGIIKLITMCFGLQFKWSIATGIWLIICLTRGIFRVTVNKN